MSDTESIAAEPRLFREEADLPGWRQALKRLLATVIRRENAEPTEELVIPEIIEEEEIEPFLDLSLYLLNFFSLKENDVPLEVISIFSESEVNDETLSSLRQFLLEDKSLEPLMLRGIVNLLISLGFKHQKAINLGFELLNSIRDGMESDFNTSVSSLVQSSRRFAEACLNLRSGELYEIDRQNALAQMKEIFGDLMTEIPGLPDEDLNERFKVRDDDHCLRHISTYFDTAQFGIEDEKGLITAARGIMEQSYSSFESRLAGTPYVDLEKWEAYKAFCQLGVLNYLMAGRKLSDYPFGLEHFYFAQSGTDAFEKFADAYLSSESKLLASSEEYKPMLEPYEKKQLAISLPDYSQFKNDDAYAEAVIEVIREHPDLKYILVSELARNGALLPLEVFKRIKENMKDRDLYIVLDGCQAFGKREPVLFESGADVYFASCQKGTEIGHAGAALLLSDAFVEQQGSLIKKEARTISDEIMARFYVASNPQVSGYRVKDELVYGHLERLQRLRDLSLHFLILSEAITDDPQLNDINILFRHDIYQYEEGQLFSDRITPIFECELEGFSRSEVSDFAKQYGVHIADSYSDPASENSFRIAFHPYMSSDSIYLLGYVLAHCKKK